MESQGYESKVLPQVGPTRRQDPNVGLDVFGGGEAAARLTSAAQGLAGQAADVFATEKGHADDAAVMGAHAQAQSKVNDTLANFKQQQGLNAHANFQAFYEDASKSLDSIGDTLSNPTQQRGFARSKAALMGTLTSEMHEHTAQQSTKAYLDNADDVVKTSMSSALLAYQNPKVVEDAYKTSAAATMAKAQFQGKTAVSAQSDVQDAHGLLTKALVEKNLYDGKPGSLDRAEAVLSSAEQNGRINEKDALQINSVLKTARMENNFQTSYQEVASKMRTSTGEMDVDKQLAYYTDKDKGNPLALNHDISKVYEYAKIESFNNLRIQRSETDTAIGWAQAFQAKEKASGIPASYHDIETAVKQQVEIIGGTPTTKLKNNKILMGMLTHDTTKDDPKTLDTLMDKLQSRTISAGDIKDALAGGYISLETARNLNEGATNPKFGLDMFTNHKHLKDLNVQLGLGDVYKPDASEDVKDRSRELSDRYNEALQLEKTIVKRTHLTIDENRKLSARVAMQFMADHPDQYPLGKYPSVVSAVAPSVPTESNAETKVAVDDDVAKFLKANNKADNPKNRALLAAHPEWMAPPKESK